MKSKSGGAEGDVHPVYLSIDEQEQMHSEGTAACISM